MNKRTISKSILVKITVLGLLAGSQAVVANSPSKSYVDRQIYDLGQQIEQLKALISNQSAGLQGPPGPVGPKGDAGPMGPPGETSAAPMSSELSGSEKVTKSYAVGDAAMGGIVFFVEDPDEFGKGYHGLIASLNDNANSVNWNGQHGMFGVYNLAINAKANGIGAGRNNTYLIMAMQTLHAKIVSDTTLARYAAQVCADYCVGENGKVKCSKNIISDDESSTLGYADWYLPSLAELNLMFHVDQLKLVGTYWSSNENTLSEAYFQSQDGQSYTAKGALMNVRCARVF